MLHVLVVVVLCCLPGAGLLAALWLTDLNREPDNSVVHEQESAPGQDPDDTLAVAAQPPRREPLSANRHPSYP